MEVPGRTFRVKIWWTRRHGKLVSVQLLFDFLEKLSGGYGGVPTRHLDLDNKMEGLETIGINFDMFIFDDDMRGRVGRRLIFAVSKLKSRVSVVRPSQREQLRTTIGQHTTITSSSGFAWRELALFPGNGVRGPKWLANELAKGEWPASERAPLAARRVPTFPATGGGRPPNASMGGARDPTSGGKLEALGGAGPAATGGGVLECGERNEMM
jgi:hypothetical protein